MGQHSQKWESPGTSVGARHSLVPAQVRHYQDSVEINSSVPHRQWEGGTCCGPLGLQREFLTIYFSVKLPSTSGNETLKQLVRPGWGLFHLSPLAGYNKSWNNIKNSELEVCCASGLRQRGELR